jgi:hypothetical protein
VACSEIISQHFASGTEQNKESLCVCVDGKIICDLKSCTIYFSALPSSRCSDVKKFIAVNILNQKLCFSANKILLFSFEFVPGGNFRLILAKCANFISVPPRPERLWSPHTLLCDGYQGSFPGGKAAAA